MLKFADPETATDTAYHEAGHVVVGWELGIRPERVLIRADAGAELMGEVEWSHRWKCLPVGRKLTVTVAGPVSEVLRLDGRLGPKGTYVRRGGPMGWRLINSTFRLTSALIRDGYLGTAPAEGVPCDVHQACKYARYFATSTADSPAQEAAKILEAVEKAEAEAEAILKRRWADAKAVAEALLTSQRGVVSGKRVAALLKAR